MHGRDGAAGGMTLDTFPEISAARMPSALARRPAMRHKDYGIWQSWTWAEQLHEVRTFALGLQELGLKHGERDRHHRRQSAAALLGIGRGRSRSALSRCRSMPTPSPRNWPMCSTMPACASPSCRTRSRSTRSSRSPRTFLQLTASDLSTNRAACAAIDARGCTIFSTSRSRGRALLAADPALGERWAEGVRAASGDDIAVMLYTSGTTGRSKGVMIKASHAVNAARDTATFDRLNETDRVLAYLPLAWVGDHYLNYAQGYVSGLLHELPGKPRHGIAGSARDRADLLFRAAAHLRNLLTSVTIRMEDAGWLKRWLFDHFIGVAQKHGEAILEGRPVPLGGRVAYALGNLLRLRPAEERAGPVQHPRRLHGRRGDRPGPFFLLPLARHQSEAALRPDRSVPLRDLQKDGAVRSDTVGPAAPNVDITHLRFRRGVVPFARHVLRLFQAGRQDRRSR